MRHEKIKIQIQGSAYYGWLYTYLWDNSRELYDGRKRPIVLLCPGGGYEMTSDREAEAMALKFMTMAVMRRCCGTAWLLPGTRKLYFNWLRLSG